MWDMVRNLTRFNSNKNENKSGDGVVSGWGAPSTGGVVHTYIPYIQM